MHTAASGALLARACEGPGGRTDLLGAGVGLLGGLEGLGGGGEVVGVGFCFFCEGVLELLGRVCVAGEGVEERHGGGEAVVVAAAAARRR